MLLCLSLPSLLHSQKVGTKGAASKRPGTAAAAAASAQQQQRVGARASVEQVVRLTEQLNTAKAELKASIQARPQPTTLRSRSCRRRELVDIYVV